MNHTPGPWRFEKELDSHQYIKTPFYIRTVPHDDFGDYLIAIGGLQTEETMHNARLIAAAPEMLAALELAIDKLEVLAATSFSPECVGAIQAMRFAINKAR